MLDRGRGVPQRRAPGRGLRRGLLALVASAALLLAGCSGKTIAPKDVYPSYATLQANGKCDGQSGKTCSYYFQYRRVGSTAVTKTPVRGNVGRMASPATFGETASRLAPDTAYEYQICGREGAWEAGKWACVGRDADSDGLGDEGNWQPLRTPRGATVNGDTADTNSSLSIEPSGKSESIVRPLSSGWDSTVGFIQRMPRTRQVSRITLGDFSLADSCTNGTSVQLFVDEHPTGDIDTRNQIAYSQTPGGADAKSPIPTTPGRVSLAYPSYHAHGGSRV